MKETGIEWSGKIPNEWKLYRLKEVVSIKNGKEVELELDEGIPVYGSGGVFKYTDRYLHDGKSVLLGRKGTIDKPQYVEGKFWTVDTSYYTIVNEEKFSTKLFYYMSQCFDYKYFQSGSTLPSMTQLDLGLIKLPIADNFEQKLIVEFLDNKVGEIDKAIKLLKQEIEKLEEYKKNIISEYLNDVKRKTKLKYIVQIKDGTHDTPDYLMNKDKGYPLITSRYVDSEHNLIDFENAPRISEKDMKDINRRSNVEFGDIIMPMIGSIGNPVIVNSRDVFSIKNLALFKTSKKPTLSKFIYYQFYSHDILQQFEQVTRGGVQSFVSLYILGNLTFRITDDFEMKYIVGKIENKIQLSDKIKKIKDRQLCSLKDYRKSLIFEYVTGKKRVI
ncbi:restriction endonuclease subunit S [Exiguobacterium sp. R-17]|uniref:restriction endonuclease subunit S n=1 Tax=Exiguobacterium sp. R-17 TaxID=3404054 RepID=UPI003CF6984F